ncbi:tetratricopeptide repeat protein [Altererythrobacter aerius]|uniref:Tetratricopeptide repeat protein n=2 Tax=Tsuneonella aeria TaxID=1837929 RepID=A0A6I4TGQ8_9SPHN|nr:tetratricopeptide repeat protein [Tsuneonella aeria]
MMAPGPAAEAPADVAYRELLAGDNRAAVERIEANAALDEGDPARLINLGVAYARQGDTERARTMFERAAAADARADLETATGEWADSRNLALRALASINRGTLAGGVRTARR